MAFYRKASPRQIALDIKLKAWHDKLDLHTVISMQLLAFHDE